MDYTDRLTAQETKIKCIGECQGCDHKQWMRCHKIETHDIQYEEVHYDRHNNFGQHDPRDNSLQS